MPAMIARVLTGKPLLYIAGGLLLTSIALAGVIALKDSSCRAAIAQLEAQRDVKAARLEAAEGALSAAVGANHRQQAAIEDLAVKLDAAIRETEDLDQLLYTAEADLTQAQRARDAALIELSSRREAVYATDSTCQSWGAAPVCSAITDSVREQWQNAARSH